MKQCGLKYFVSCVLLSIAFIQISYSANLEDYLPVDRVNQLILGYIEDPREREAASQQWTEKKDLFNSAIGTFENIPEVRTEELESLNGLDTDIRQPIPAFQAAATLVTVRAWRMTGLPDPYHQVEGMSNEKKLEIKKIWDANLDLPITYVSLSDAKAFVEIGKIMTGENFDLPTNSELEYLIRGRMVNADGSFGAITRTRFFYGDNEEEIQDHAWMNRNSGKRAHGVKEGNFLNSFKLYNVIGNVFQRESEGGYRGGCYYNSPVNLESDVHGGKPQVRSDSIGFRVIKRLTISHILH